MVKSLDLGLYFPGSKIWHLPFVKAPILPRPHSLLLQEREREIGQIGASLPDWLLPTLKLKSLRLPNNGLLEFLSSLSIVIRDRVTVVPPHPTTTTKYCITYRYKT